MYCQNCGSILQNNANFCHVCGTKVEIDDIFDVKPKEEVKEEKASEVYEEASNDYQEYQREEMPKSCNYFSDIETETQPIRKRKPFIPGLISMIIGFYTGIQAGFTYLINIIYQNGMYNTGAIEYNKYLSAVSDAIDKVIAVLFLGIVAGSILGGVGLKLSLQEKCQSGKWFSILGIAIAVIELIVVILLIVEKQFLV